VLRWLFIVARDTSRLYGYLADAFQDDPEVHVLMDRRVGERRRQHWAHGTAERRQAQRRQHSDVDARLRAVGYAFVKLPT
jgi:hypothetical protein